MFASFSTALSALGAYSTGVDVVGNNLANLNTPGFKNSVVSFHDLVSQTLANGSGDTQIGFGVGRPTTLRQFTQGSLQTTSAPLDVAIRGEGFLILRDAAGGTLYSRGGHLQLDRNGRLTTSSGERVQGWTQTAGVLSSTGPLADIVIPAGRIQPPVATRSFSFEANLNAAATAGPPAEQFSTSIEVFDSLGGSHLITVRYTKAAAAGEWQYEISIPDADVTAPVAPLTGSLTFDAQGRLTAPAADAEPPKFAVTGLANGAADLELSWRLYDGATPRLTQFGRPSAVSANAQDGAPAAQLVRVTLGDGGAALAHYSSGQQEIVAQLAMASVRNPESLLAAGNNNYQLGARSAAPAVGLPGTGGRGVILGGTIEGSTADIAREFTNLIVLQRGYQANARVLTAVDELSQETINLRR